MYNKRIRYIPTSIPDIFVNLMSDLPPPGGIDKTIESFFIDNFLEHVRFTRPELMLVMKPQMS